jgi:hypothetical protein
VIRITGRGVQCSPTIDQREATMENLDVAKTTMDLLEAQQFDQADR